MRLRPDSRVLLSGASSGIGLEIARQLAPRIKAIVLVARRRDRLEALASELQKINPSLAVYVETADLSDPASWKPLAAKAEELMGAVDVLINNAGFGQVGLFELYEFERSRQMLRLNSEAPMALTHALLGGMLERGHGIILNVSSGFGLSVLPGFSVYCASKHALTAFTEALHSELGSKGILVSQLCPGPVATEFEQSAGNNTGLEAPSWMFMSAQRCARIAIRLIERGRALIIPGITWQILIWLGALTPRWFLRIIHRILAKRLRKSELARLKTSAGTP